MSDEKEYGLTNEGTDGVIEVPIETKEPTLNPIVPTVSKRKRGRPAKKMVEVEAKPEKIWYCSTCRLTIADEEVMRIGAGDGGRCAIFCPDCQKSLGFLHPDVDAKVAEFIRNNPTGK